MGQKYTVDYFIEFFEAIPAKNWLVGDFSRGTQKCALGHCGFSPGNPTRKSLALGELFWQHLKTCVSLVNDGNDNSIKGRDAKTRILKALRVIKKVQPS